PPRGSTCWRGCRGGRSATPHRAFVPVPDLPPSPPTATPPSQRALEIAHSFSPSSLGGLGPTRDIPSLRPTARPVDPPRRPYENAICVCRNSKRSNEGVC